MSVKHPVRDDQHGTHTGYVYGCRCPECTKAIREYHRQHEDQPSNASLDLVFCALEHEADMEGLVTATGDRLAELSGLSRLWVGKTIRKLAEAGRIHLVDPVVSTRGGVLCIQLKTDASDPVEVSL